MFDISSDVFARQREYAKYFDHTTILVLNTKSKLRTTYHELRTNSLDIIPVNAMGKLDLIPKTINIAKKIHKLEPCTLITTQDPLVSGYIGRQLKAKLHIPLNVQIHTDILSEAWKKQSLQNRLMACWIKPNLLAADSIRVVSESIKQSVANYVLRTTNYEHSVFVAPVRVDLDAFYKPAHYKTSCIRCISVGRLVVEKNYPMLIEAFAEVVKQQPLAKLTIVGDGPEKSKLATQIVQNHLNNNVFLVGQKSTLEVASLLHQHDIFMLSSSYEGWGMVYVEAFAAGLPVITTPVASVGELLQPNINCLIATDATNYALRTTYLMTHSEEVYRLAKNGQMWVKNNLESEILIKRWIDGLFATVQTQSK
jgi:glycosyltransferase involved in cell wall biosynthesis